MSTLQEQINQVAPPIAESLHALSQMIAPAPIAVTPEETPVTDTAVTVQPEVTAQPDEAGATDEEIIGTAVSHLKDGKSDAETKAALSDEYEDIEHDADQLISTAHAQIDSDKKDKVSALETSNQELLDGLNEDELTSVEALLVPIPNDNLDEQIAALEHNDRILREAMTVPSEQPEKPKFGKFDGPIVSTFVKGRMNAVWVDVDGVSIHTGEQVQMTPGLRDKIDRERKYRGDEWLAKERRDQAHETYAMTKEEFDQEAQKEFPVFVLPKQPGPQWNDSIMYGPAGDLIRKASQHCESHPAGMLVDFLVSFGSIVGRGPYFNIGSTKHYTNEFMARVGDSSRSRKGTGRDAIDEVLKLVDPEWYSNSIESGFGSGEAIINRIRDSVVESKLNHKTRKFENTTIPGIADKRLCIREGELASIFVLAGKADSRADIVIRDGWDGKTLRNVVKGKSKDGFSNSAKCEQPHLSISGDTTIHELRMKMPDGADENGFGNRFLYVYVYRVKHCPQGGPELDWSNEISQFHEIVKFARTVRLVSMTQSARNWWNQQYTKLEDGPDGLAGKMTARAAAHIRRIAMLYALIDRTDVVTLEHFQYAKKLWDYCEESALFIFGGVTREQLRIVNWIGQRRGATYRQVRDDLYQRHRNAGQIKTDLDALVKQDKLVLNGEIYLKT